MRKKSLLIFTFLWIAVISGGVGMLHSWHFADYTPKENSLNFRALSSIDGEDFGVLHFLTPLCSCSESIYKHLIQRGPLKDNISESVIVIDDNKLNFSSNLKDKGFKVKSYTSDELKKEFSDGIKGVPLLVIFDKDQNTRYVGGYSEQLITPFTKIDINSFISKAKNKDKLSSLPVKGCSVSKEYQQILDPLGLKYTQG